MPRTPAHRVSGSAREARGELLDVCGAPATLPCKSVCARTSMVNCLPSPATSTCMSIANSASHSPGGSGSCCSSAAPGPSSTACSAACTSATGQQRRTVGNAHARSHADLPAADVAGSPHLGAPGRPPLPTRCRHGTRPSLEAPARCQTAAHAPPRPRTWCAGRRGWSVATATPRQGSCAPCPGLTNPCHCRARWRPGTMRWPAAVRMAPACTRVHTAPLLISATKPGRAHCSMSEMRSPRASRTLLLCGWRLRRSASGQRLAPAAARSPARRPSFAAIPVNAAARWTRAAVRLHSLCCGPH